MASILYYGIKINIYVHMRFPGLPVHKLILKVVTIVMLIRNLSMNDKLRNCTRMKIIGLFKFNIKVEIITGTQAGNSVYTLEPPYKRPPYSGSVDGVLGCGA